MPVCSESLRFAHCASLVRACVHDILSYVFEACACLVHNGIFAITLACCHKKHQREQPSFAAFISVIAVQKKGTFPVPLARGIKIFMILGSSSWVG